MGHTNETANYDLPQFIGTDKPTWLGDVNGAMAAIDAAIANAESAATDAASVAANAATVAAGATTTANAASETATAASTAASAATTTANNAAETANNAQSTAVLAKNTADGAASAIGDLTDLDTTDKTSVVNAINEVNGKADRGSVSVTADGVKTIGALFDELVALIDATKITPLSVLTTAEGIFHLAKNASAKYEFVASTLHTTGNFYFDSLTLSKSGSNSAWHRFICATTGITYDGTITDNVASSNTVFTIHY